MIALGFNGRRDGTIIQPKRSGEFEQGHGNEVTEMNFLYMC